MKKLWFMLSALVLSAATVAYYSGQGWMLAAGLGLVGAFLLIVATLES